MSILKQLEAIGIKRSTLAKRLKISERALARYFKDARRLNKSQRAILQEIYNQKTSQKQPRKIEKPKSRKLAEALQYATPSEVRKKLNINKKVYKDLVKGRYQLTNEGRRLLTDLIERKRVLLATKRKKEKKKKVAKKKIEKLSRNEVIENVKTVFKKLNKEIHNKLILDSGVAYVLANDAVFNWLNNYEQYLENKLESDFLRKLEKQVSDGRKKFNFTIMVYDPDTNKYSKEKFEINL